MSKPCRFRYRFLPMIDFLTNYKVQFFRIYIKYEAFSLSICSDNNMLILK